MCRLHRLKILGEFSCQLLTFVGHDVPEMVSSTDLFGDVSTCAGRHFLDRGHFRIVGLLKNNNSERIWGCIGPMYPQKIIMAVHILFRQIMIYPKKRLLYVLMTFYEIHRPVAVRMSWCPQVNHSEENVNFRKLWALEIGDPPKSPIIRDKPTFFGVSKFEKPPNFSSPFGRPPTGRILH